MGNIFAGKIVEAIRERNGIFAKFMQKERS
jgi:hypothetical protein